jgi:eukaryotic-like serine/threonine-protein kinase
MNPGDVVAGRFEIDRPATSGGMATIYRAVDRVGGEPVALKVLNQWGMRYPERFLREARVLAELRHPGIVRYIAHGQAGSGELYLAMEWLDGEDLLSRLARTRIAMPEAVTLVRRVAEAMAAAHAHGVVHRDLKPSNLFLVDGYIDRVKVIDFGIARVANPTRHMTSTGTRMGTPWYMAPEQARGARDLDARADVFSLGCVLFECLTGRPPFVGADPMAVLAKIVLEIPPRVSEILEAVPDDLDDLVARMLVKDPDGRPRDGAAVAAEIAALAPIGSTLRASAIRNASLTAGEQRILSVVLAGAPPDHAVLTQQTLPALPPPQASRVWSSLRDAVKTHSGTLEELADGTVVAVIAGAGAATDQAARAARCALAVRAILRDVPMSLATGRGMVHGRMPVGEVIDRAVRLVRASGEWLSPTVPDLDDGTAASEPRPRLKPIRVDELTAGLVGGRFEIGGDPTSLELRGERDVIEIQRTLLGKHTPTVGRQRELTSLSQTLDECVREPVARVVLVTGPAGVGKSRLRQEFTKRALTRTSWGGSPGSAGRGAEGPLIDVWTGRGDPLGAGSPFAMLSQAIRRAMSLFEGEPLAVRRRKLRARVARHLPASELDRVATFLGELLGVPFPDEGHVQLRAARRDARLMGDQMRRAFEDWAAAECDAQPVLLVLEDLHWGDLPTVKFVEGALRRLADKPFMVLALARPEVHELFPNLWVERGLEEIRISELTRRAAEELVRSALGDDVGADKLDWILSRAGGNAFYLEELIRAVAEGRELPETVVAMVQMRLAGMEMEARRVLRAASIFGRVFWRGGVGVLLGSSGKKEALEWLAELVEREVIVRRGDAKFGDEDEYAFRSSIVREAAYGMLTENDRALGHRLAGEWLEQVGEREAVVLAEHFQRGGLYPRAAAFWRRAAEQALEGNDLEAAVQRARHGVEVGAQGELLGSLRVIEAEAHDWRGEMAEVERCAIEGLACVPPGSEVWYRAAALVIGAAAAMGDPKRLTAAVDRVRRAESPPDLSPDRANALLRAATWLFHAGRYDAGDVFVDEVEQKGGHVVIENPAVAGRFHQARAVRALTAGDPVAALDGFDQAARSFEAAGDLRNALGHMINVGYAAMQAGDWARAERALRAVLTQAERQGLHALSAAARHNLGMALARLGSLDDALSIEQMALRELGASGDRRMEGGARIYLSTILLEKGDLAGAREQAAAAVEICATIPPSRAYALATLAEACLRSGRDGEALDAAEQAMRILDELGGLDEGESRVRIVWAEALAAAGRSSEARVAYEDARRRLLERADRIGDAGARETFLQAIPEHARTLRPV